MFLFRELAVISALAFGGELLSRLLHMPIPGNVAGMLLLLLLLGSRLLSLKSVEGVSDFLLGNLAFFFIPAGVGLLHVTGLLVGVWWKLLVIAVVTTVVVMAVTAVTVALLRKGVRGGRTM